jgi:hypothetical protein
MNIYKSALSAASLVLILGTSSQFAQERPNQHDHTLAFGLLKRLGYLEST